MARTNFVKIGKPMISNVNLFSGIDANIFTSNLTNFTPGVLRKRNKRLIRFKKGADITSLFFDINRKVFLYVSKNILYEEGNLTDKELLTNVESDINFVSFNNKVYFISKKIVYEYDGAVVSVSQSNITRYLIAPNNLSVTNGSNIMTIRIEFHGLSVGDKISLESFQGDFNKFGGVDINQTISVTNVIDSNTIQVQYPEVFQETITEGGGNGIIKTSGTIEPFPTATSICEYKNRLYLANDQTLYISNLLIPDEKEVRFGRYTPERVYSTVNNIFLNEAIANLITEPHWVIIGNASEGSIIQIHSSPFGVIIFKERGIYVTSGTITDQVSQIHIRDTIVNKRCVDSTGYYTYFIGFNNMYQISSNGISIIGYPHKRYIEDKNNLDTRLACYDGTVIAYIGDFRIKKLEGDYPEMFEEDLALVYTEKNEYNDENFTFFTNFKFSDFEVINNVLYLSYKNEISRYSTSKIERENSEIQEHDFSCKVLTHAIFLDEDIVNEYTVEKVYVFGKRIVDLKMNYKTTDNSGFEEAKQILSKDNNMVELDLSYKNKGRGIELMFKNMDRSELELHGFIIEFNK